MKKHDMLFKWLKCRHDRRAKIFATKGECHSYTCKVKSSETITTNQSIAIERFKAIQGQFYQCKSSFLHAPCYKKFCDTGYKILANESVEYTSLGNMEDVPAEKLEDDMLRWNTNDTGDGVNILIDIPSLQDFEITVRST